MIDIESLNEQQREAVLSTEGPLLVLAGAGSGKTRVLTYRIAHLVEDLDVAPWQILAITFTNKAAAEMRERLSGLIGGRVRGMWVSTFHSMCVRILRADAETLGFTKNFTIYDDADSKRLYKDIMAELDIDSKRYPLNTIRNRISQAKNELVVVEDFESRTVDPIGKVAARVYRRLQQRLRAANAFDFDDLLLYAYLLLKHHPEILEAYQQRFRYILVDEYQDTNHAQYAITRLIASAHENLMVVGDDDQSIYSWRGADIRNILEFEQDYPNCKTVKLEENYRSVGNVLEAANAVIANNVNRKAKKLYTSSESGEKIKLYMAADERDEGRWVASRIDQLHASGVSYDEIAVFYRTNAQSRMLEDMFLRAGVPYRIVGGTRFFERQEISDVMAYLTLAVNPADDIAALRVINVPRRGVGKTTVERILEIARAENTSFMIAAELTIADDALRPASRKAISEFVQIVKDASSYSGDLRNIVEMIIEKSGLIDALEAENTDEARGRIENIHEFLGVVDEFSQTHRYYDDLDNADISARGRSQAAHETFDVGTSLSYEDDEVFFAAPSPNDVASSQPVRVLRGNSLGDFIEWVRLRTDLDTAADGGHAVTLMTIHASKGLEFDAVFVTGMEESIFPHVNSIGEASGLEEERRLAYVAITRAKKKLYLTCAAQRQLFGQRNVNPISRFVREIPSEIIETAGIGSVGFSGTGWEKRGSRRGISGSGTEAGNGAVFAKSSAYGSGERARNARTGLSQSKRSNFAANAVFSKGDIVDHKTFGRGTVTNVDGDVVFVHFSKLNQTKKLLKDFAPIVKIEQ